MNKNFTFLLNFIAFFLFLTGNIMAQSKNGSVSGSIKTSDGNPASYVSVGLKNTGKTTQTDEKGNFTIKNITPGTYTIKTSAVGVSAQEKSVTVVAGETVNADFTIAESLSQLDEVAINGYKTPNRKPVNLGKIAIAPMDLPQAVQIIGKQIITDQQVNSLGDVMKNVNGVALGANRGAVGENFFARGYSLGSNNIFKNGARTTIGGSPEASTLESVEVLKGSAALLYGGVTGGAVVNMVTKKPKFENGGEVSMRTGSYDQYKPTVDLYGPISKKLAFRAIGTYENAGSFRDFVKSKRFYVNPSLLYKVSEQTEVLVQGDYLKSDFTPDFGVGSVNNQIVDFGRDKFINTPWAYNKTNTTTAQANLTHKFNENWKLNAIGSFQAYNRNYYGSERIQANAAGISTRNLSRALSKEYTYNQQININGSFNTGSIKHTVLFGVDADQSRVTSNAFAYGKDAKGVNITILNYGNVNVFDPTTYYGSGIMPEAFGITSTLAPTYRYGAFVQDLIEITEQFKVLAGLRYTDQKNASSRALNLETGVTTPGATKFDDAFSPKLGLIYQPLKTTSLYISYANNFITNTGTDIYYAALPPSLVDQYEAGIKNDFFGGRLSANLTYYKIKNSNTAQTAMFDQNGNLNSNTNIKQLNGTTSSDGVEIDLTGSILPGLNLTAGYSYNFMRYTNTPDIIGMIEDVRLVGTTKNTANATLFYTFQEGAVKGLKLGASAFYTGKRNGGWNDAKNAPVLRLIPLSAFTTVDFSAGYNWKKFSLLAKVSNITNELNYFVHENYSVNPIAPRQFVTTLSYKF
ncbi:TonB-dependent receptor [Pedobacter sp. SG918]|uniref:TonB-dependent receptor n=2 Tax=unclassified Pedobacter TaxID=2628915 RepID=UPI001421DA44|nr:TonB-dependent receptor [Pedobacter sp. SG918]NII82398.1 iron complex outermembrane receptor protein [Pedobacter sp. SG908]NMN36424.1 iron complex outermembrane receptor protein [Pedobacter sp. SG918]